MGFLSKANKSIKKGFKKVAGFVGKLANSTFGKVLLAAVVIFTLGTALIAGASAFATTTGTFAAKFVAGAQAFAGALASPLKTAKGLFNGAASKAAGAAAGQAAGAAAGQVAGVAETAGAVGAAAPATTPIGVLTSGADAGIAAAQASAAAAPATGGLATAGSNLAAGAAKKGFLSQAAGAAGKVVSNPGFVTVAGKVLEGAAQGAAQKDVFREERRERERIDAQFRDPEKIRQLQEAASNPVTIGQGFIERARNVADFMNGRTGSGTRQQPGNPNDAFGRYVVGY